MYSQKKKSRGISLEGTRWSSDGIVCGNQFPWIFSTERAPLELQNENNKALRLAPIACRFYSLFFQNRLDMRNSSNMSRHTTLVTVSAEVKAPKETLSIRTEYKTH